MWCCVGKGNKRKQREERSWGVLDIGARLQRRVYAGGCAGGSARR